MRGAAQPQQEVQHHGHGHGQDGHDGQNGDPVFRPKHCQYEQPMEPDIARPH